MSYLQDLLNKGFNEDIIKQISLIGLQSLMAKSRGKKGRGQFTIPCDSDFWKTREKPFSCLTYEEKKAREAEARAKNDWMKTPVGERIDPKMAAINNYRARGKITPTQKYGEIPPETEEQRRIRTMRTSGFN
jgi:hypothetical protein